MLEDLIDVDRRSRTLFEEDSGRRDLLMVAMDQVNMRFGKFAAVPVSQGLTRAWAARSDRKSHSYTNREDDPSPGMQHKNGKLRLPFKSILDDLISVV